jgi:hypothetical protein
VGHWAAGEQHSRPGANKSNPLPAATGCPLPALFFLRRIAFASALGMSSFESSHSILLQVELDVSPAIGINNVNEQSSTSCGTG